MLKVSYVTEYDATNIHEWSGIGYFLGNALAKQDINLEYVGDLNNKWDTIFKAKQVAYLLAGKKYLRDREPVITQSYAKQVMKRISSDTDVIFSPGTIPIAFVETKKHKVIYTDCTFGGIIDYYKEFSNLCNETIKSGNELEQRALDTCSLAIFSSQWAADTAIQLYNTSPGKIKIVPFGANLNTQRTLADIKNIYSTKSTSVCKLLFLGVDWNRKGGDIAFKTAQLLNELGINTELHIVGIKNIPIANLPSFVKMHGFISKSTEEGQRRINNLLEESHFLILPTKADCTPVVFSEACSFGLPCISTKTGGITTVIIDEVNGKTFDLSSESREYANFIADKFSNKHEYKELCLSSFADYQNRLNWEAATNSITKLFREL
jgi:glycosyltransferase involved in cell wall biosynthesis